MRKFLVILKNLLKDILSTFHDREAALQTILYFGVDPSNALSPHIIAAYYDLNWSFDEPIGFDLFPVSAEGVALAFAKSRDIGALFVDIRPMLHQAVPIMRYT